MAKSFRATDWIIAVRTTQLKNNQRMKTDNLSHKLTISRFDLVRTKSEARSHQNRAKDQKNKHDERHLKEWLVAQKDMHTRVDHPIDRSAAPH
jgi:hypothetical protein